MASHRLIIDDIVDFLRLEIPPRKEILHPWLYTQGLAMIHAYRGIGKTHVALGIACAVSTGSSFFGWTSPEPHRVVFVDGEMPAGVVQERLKAQFAAMRKIPEPGFFRLITPDRQKSSIPDLSEKKGQDKLKTVINQGEVDLVILDNVSTLFRSGKENESESWIPAQEFALLLRRSGIAVIFIHHSGKGGLQRGTSRKEDVLDTVLNLRLPKGYSKADGARFEVHFEKARGIWGDDVMPFEAKLEVRDEKAYWFISGIGSDERVKEVAELVNFGKKTNEIAEEMGVSKSSVGRWIKLAKKKGLIEETKKVEDDER